MNVRMRFATPNEQRAISREHHGFYKSLFLGAIYEFPRSDIDVRSSRSFFGALKRCIDKYPSLSVVIQDKHTDAAFYERVPTISLQDHITIVEESDVDVLAAKEGSSDEMTKIERLLPSTLDCTFAPTLPPWKIVVLPLSSSKLQGTEQKRCLVGFVFSHCLGDGINGLAFHRTFRDGIFDQVDDGCSTLATPVADFPAPFDTAERLSISWGFLLAPLIAVLLPKFIAEMLGLRATASDVNADTWIGPRMFFEPESSHSHPKLVEIEGPAVENALRLARKNGAKLTGTIHQSIIRALSKAIPSGEATNFVSGTAVNMRKSIGISNDEMGYFANACYGFHVREDAWASPLSDQAWASARSLTEKLVDCATRLQDQPIGLLRYIPSISKWTAAKIGEQRDCSYQLSNLGSFDASSPQAAAGCRCDITKMVFSQPASAISSPLVFSVVSVKGGSMVISIVWQTGALGIPVESETAFVDGIRAFLIEDLKNLQ